MKTIYSKASVYFSIRCNETHEERDFSSECECVEWATKVAHTFGQKMSFTVTKVVESECEIWANSNAEYGMVH